MYLGSVELERKLGRAGERKFLFRFPVIFYSMRCSAWTLKHAFFIISGGFHYYLNGQPTYPLSIDDVQELVRSRSLIPPTSTELKDKSKGDGTSKMIAIFQTMWFIVQCIARHIENLAITNLEIMTLAYTVITLAMYIAWWHKPLNVTCAIRVQGHKLLNTSEHQDVYNWQQSIKGAAGAPQDWHMPVGAQLDRHDRVPTFWSSAYSHKGNKIPLYADIAALSVAVVFGAVHCAAWEYAFPSLAEQTMWRVSAVIIAAVPMPMMITFIAFSQYFVEYDQGFLSGRISFVAMCLAALLYIPARTILLVLSFSTLRDLPPSAYQTVNWISLIPHV